MSDYESDRLSRYNCMFSLLIPHFKSGTRNLRTNGAKKSP